MVEESIAEEQRLLRQREYNRAYRAANRDRLRQQVAFRTAANPEPARERLKRFKERNPGSDSAYSRAYRARHPDKRKQTVAKYDSANAGKRKEYGQKYSEANRPKLAAKSAYRRATKKQATPAWADLNAIRLVYEEARDLSKKTGQQQHVDHIVPLQSKRVCGLHCEANLQIISGGENARKHNSFWPDMP